MEELVKQEEEHLRAKSPGEHKGKKKKGPAGSPKGTTPAATSKKEGDGHTKGPSNFSTAIKKDDKSKKDDKTSVVSEKTKVG